MKKKKWKRREEKEENNKKKKSKSYTKKEKPKKVRAYGRTGTFWPQNIAERISEATMGAEGARDRGKKKALNLGGPTSIDFAYFWESNYKQRSCDGRAQRPVWCGNELKKTGARSARARTRGQNTLVPVYFCAVSDSRCFSIGFYRMQRRRT